MSGFDVRTVLVLGCVGLWLLVGYAGPAATAEGIASQAGKVLHVAPDGRDAWSGSLRRPNERGTDGPLASLEGARDTIRELKANGGLPRGGIAVRVQGGTYRLEKPLELTARDSGTADRPITYYAPRDQQAVLSGGRTLEPFKPLEDPSVRERLPEEARGHVVGIDLKAQGIKDPGTFKGGYKKDGGTVMLVFWGERRLELARWPNDGFARVKELIGGNKIEAWDGEMREGRGFFRYEKERIDRWVEEPTCRLHGFWYYDWYDQRIKVKEIDPENNTIDLGTHYPGFKEGQWYYAFNVLAELDRPGEFYLNRDEGMIYLWPPASMDGQKPVACMLPHIVEMKDVSHVTLRGLTLGGSRDTALRVKGGKKVRVAGCTFRNVGSWGAKITGATQSGVIGCDLYNLGEGGILLNGGEQKSLTPAGLYAENNHIHHFAQWNPVYNPGIRIEGVGNRATHNLIHHAPHFAMRLKGNEHRIEFNEIHNVCSITNDAGAIYAGGSWIERGNVLRHNFFHHMYGFNGRGCFVVYLDDQFSGALVEGNVFWEVPGATCIGGGRDNTLVNNIYMDCFPAVRIDARGLGWRSYGRENFMKELESVPYREPPWSKRYPRLANILKGTPMAPEGTVVKRNICSGGPWSDIEKKARPYVKFKNNLVTEKPGFVAPERGNFRLKKDSPALRKGFEQIPMGRIGPYQDPLRASWPVKHEVRRRERREKPDWMKAGE